MPPATAGASSGAASSNSQQPLLVASGGCHFSGSCMGRSCRRNGSRTSPNASRVVAPSNRSSPGSPTITSESPRRRSHSNAAVATSLGSPGHPREITCGMWPDPELLQNSLRNRRVHSARIDEAILFLSLRAIRRVAHADPDESQPHGRLRRRLDDGRRSQLS